MQPDVQPEFATERLRLRAWNLDDLDFIVAMEMDPEVGRYIYPHGRPTIQERTVVTRQRINSGWPKQGGMWLVEWAESGDLIGWCGMFPLERTDLVEIGYRFITAAWGKGVATEAARRVLDHGFRALELDPIVAVTHPENAGSQNVLTKIGLESHGLQFHYGLDLSYFSLRRADYLTAR